MANITKGEASNEPPEVLHHSDLLFQILEDSGMNSQSELFTSENDVSETGDKIPARDYMSEICSSFKDIFGNIKTITDDYQNRRK